MTSTIENARQDDARVADRRWDRRRAGKQIGRVRIAGYSTGVECRLTNQSSSGAMLDFSAAVAASNFTVNALPDAISLVIPYERTVVDCHVVWRDTDRIGVRFISRMRQSSTARQK